MPAAVLIPTPIAYIKVAAVKKRERAVRCEASHRPSRPLPLGASLMLLAECPTTRSIYFEKIRVFKAGPNLLDTTARNNGIGPQFHFVGFQN